MTGSRKRVSARSIVMLAVFAAVALLWGGGCSKPKDVIKVGVIAAFSGPFTSIGADIQDGIQAYLKEHGDTVHGRKIEVLYRDTTGPSPEIAKRLAQELVVRDQVDFLPRGAARRPGPDDGLSPDGRPRWDLGESQAQLRAP